MQDGGGIPALSSIRYNPLEGPRFFPLFSREEPPSLQRRLYFGMCGCLNFFGQGSSSTGLQEETVSSTLAKMEDNVHSSFWLKKAVDRSKRPRTNKNPHE